MPKTTKQLEAEVQSLQTQLEVLTFATLTLVDAIAIALETTGTMPKEKVAQSIIELVRARRRPDDDAVGLATLKVLGPRPHMHTVSHVDF